MSSDEMRVLRQDIEALRGEVQAMHGTLGIIHKAVLGMAGKTYVPGPRRSVWSRIGSLFGMLI